jgi:predicted ATPase/class 3 adenylate cyclase
VANLPTGTLTFLFTDIEGSTKLWEQDSSSMQVALARHEEVLRSAIEERGGYVFKTVGDAFCCAFPTAPDALEAALETQRRLLSSEWEESGPLRVRMALHTGAAEERDGDYFGPPVNRVARLLSAAHGGQVLLSLPTQELVRDQLPWGTSLRDLGEHRLKDLFRPERVFQLLALGLPSEFPPLRTLDAYRNNLPLQPTPLVGREKEVAEVCERLSRPEVRLLTLTGAGGAGKTRLGLQAAAELTEGFEDGAFFVSLAAIRDLELVVSAVAGTLGVKEAGGQPLLESLEDHLGEKHILLMLDNFEQVLEAAPMVTELLSAAPYLKVLATSRIPLRLYGEHEYSVPPLALPDPERPPPVERLTHYEAVRLFVERAQAAKADFSVTNENAPAVAEICHRLDGLPLAIELAAARIKLLTPQAMLARLGNRLKLLTGGARDLPERQRTLRSAIEWSYGLLDGGEKVLFARLAVFSGGCTLEAVEAICDAEGDLPVEVLDGVESLVDKSLLRQKEGVGGEPRLVMLETIHEYAREKLEDNGEVETIKRAHAYYFLTLAEEAAPKLTTAEQEAWLERLETEHDNLRAALSRSLGRNDADLALRLGGALWRFWFVRGYLSEGLRWLEEVLDLGGGVTALRAEVLNGAGDLVWSQGNYVRAKELYEESLALSRQLGDKRDIAVALENLGSVARNWGDYATARSLFEEALPLRRELGDKWGLAESLFLWGAAATFQGDYATARPLLEEALVLYRETGEQRGIGEALGVLGLLTASQDDYGAAGNLIEEAKAVMKRLGYRRGVGKVLGAHGDLALEQRDYELAYALYEEALTIFVDFDDKWWIAWCLEGIGGISAAQDQPVRAVRIFAAAKAVRDAMDTPGMAGHRAIYERHLATARAQLDETTFEAVWSEGRHMDLEAAVSYAMEEEADG